MERPFAFVYFNLQSKAIYDEFKLYFTKALKVLRTAFSRNELGSFIKVGEYEKILIEILERNSQTKGSHTQQDLNRIYLEVVRNVSKKLNSKLSNGQVFEPLELKNLCLINSVSFMKQICKLEIFISNKV